MHVVPMKHTSVFSGNSEANASEFPENTQIWFLDHRGGWHSCNNTNMLCRETSYFGAPRSGFTRPEFNSQSN